MIRQKTKNCGPIIIDLTGPDGNAFVLIATAKRLAKQLEWDNSRISKMINEMMSSDYEHLIQTFDNNFGEFVILER